MSEVIRVDSDNKRVKVRPGRTDLYKWVMGPRGAWVLMKRNKVGDCYVRDRMQRSKKP